MTKNLHIEHPEDSILSGDLSVLDAFLMEQQISVKYDGAPAIVWGKNPATGRQFVGTKSVFNKIKIKINESHEDIDRNHNGQVAEILHECFDCLPDTDSIIQGDFIGFGGEGQYTPNTIEYDFDMHDDGTVVTENIIVAPHTEYTADCDLRDAEAKPILDNLEGTESCLFVRPHAGTANDSYNRFGNRFEFGMYLEFVRMMAQLVVFASVKEARKITKELNSYIRDGKEIDPDQFDNPKLISFWISVKTLKMIALSQCRHRWGPDAYIVNPEEDSIESIDAEGYVIHSDGGSYKLVDRELFSYANFNNVKWAADSPAGGT